MTDLAACRVIFYFEEDLCQFANVLYDGFKVVDDENKVTPNEYTKWLSDKHQIENWYATKLIEIIFPAFGSDLELFVLELVHCNDVKTLEIALQILGRYEGEPSIHKAIKEIIKLYSLDKDLKITLFRLLSGIKGLVGGEYGFLDAYKLKKEQTIGWLEDPDDQVRKFTEEYLAYLDKLINEEKSRVDKQITFEKREFDINKT